MGGWNLTSFAESSRRLRAVATCLVGLILVLLSGYLDPLLHAISIPILKSTLEVLRDFVREVGFALVVAVVIWTVFEYFARSENEAMWNERIQQTAENIFYAIHRRHLPPEYVGLANEIVLSPKFIRTGWQIDYSLRDSQYQQNAASIQFVAVTCVSRFEIRNITDQVQSFPVQVSLPNPLHSGLKEKVGVSGIIIWRAGKREDLELATAERDFRKKLQTDSFQVRFSAGSLALQPGEKIEIALTFTLAKQAEDAEVLQGSYPSDTLRISIVDHGQTRRLIGARSIHPDELEHISPAGADNTHQFRINRYMLPHHGAVIWWKLAE